LIKEYECSKQDGQEMKAKLCMQNLIPHNKNISTKTEYSGPLTYELFVWLVVTQVGRKSRLFFP